MDKIIIKYPNLLCQPKQKFLDLKTLKHKKAWLKMKLKQDSVI